MYVRVQVCVFCLANDAVSSFCRLYKKVPRVFIPVVWVDQRIIVTEKIASNLKALHHLVTLSPAVSMFVLISGLILLLVALLRTRSNKLRQKQMSS